MKKRAFLVPTTLALAALTQGNAQASVNPTQSKADGSESVRAAESGQSALRASIEARGASISTYSVNDDLFGFVIERGAAGTVTADHYSHMSHSSHASHASHSSHYSGR